MLALALPALEHLRKTPPPETRVDIVTPPATNPFFALSPDGRQLVFRATDEDGQSRLWLRALATTSAQPLPGTEGAGGPFWSPDGRSLGFFAAGALKRLDLGGGAPRILAPVTLSRGGAWGADGAVVFADSGNPLLRVSADGGEVSAVTTLGPEQGGHVHPHLLPDGRHVLFYAPGTGDMAGIYLGELEGGASIRLTAAESHGEYLPSGWLLWVRAGALVAQRLDLARATLTGEPLTLADGVAVSDEAQGRGAFAVSAAGLVAYRTGGQADARQLTWVDRAGTVLGTIGDADGSLHNPRVAPDGQRVAVARTVQSNTDLWLLDDMRASRFTFVASADQYPVWSADGGRLVFSSTRAGQFDLYQRLVSGAAEEEALLLSDQDKFASNLTADGRFLLYFIVGAQGTDLWVLATAGKPTPLPFLQTRFNERWGAFSPDGRWVAYASNESGRDEIYVRPFVPPGEESTAAVTVGQWQVSTAGGIQPLWSPDGRELYYLNPEGGMMAAAVSVSADGFAPGAPELLFPTRIVGSGLSQGQGRQYDVAADGRFLINTVLNTATPPPITLIQNWNPPETP
jgi:Tol biopolymer transport system component